MAKKTVARRSPPKKQESALVLAGIVGGEVQVRRLDAFAPNPWNPNEMEPEEFESLKEGLRVKGWARSDALLVWGTNEDGKLQNLIINGEHRWSAAREIGMVDGPVVVMDGISREEAVQWTIRLDKARGRFNPDKLNLTLRNELDFRNRDDRFALQLGFSAAEARDLRVQIPALGGRGPLMTPDEGRAQRDGAIADADEGPEVNPTNELRRKWGTKLGQLWLIPSAKGTGTHRILCGDSTKPKDVARLMGQRRAALLQTDAPYGVSLVKTKAGMPGLGNLDERFGDIENDDLEGPELQAFLEKAIRAALPSLTETAAYYFWHAHLTQGFFFAAAAAADILLHRQIIWKKPAFILTRSGMYHWKHEPCFFGWRRGNKPPWYGDKAQSTVWEIGRDDDRGMHPTQKPIALWLPALLNHTKEGEVAYEPFSGSGGQVLACEQIGRVCCAMELAPKYVAVALERASLRGLKPRLAKTKGA